MLELARVSLLLTRHKSLSNLGKGPHYHAVLVSSGVSLVPALVLAPQIVQVRVNKKIRAGGRKQGFIGRKDLTEVFSYP